MSPSPDRRPAAPADRIPDDPAPGASVAADPVSPDSAAADPAPAAARAPHDAPHPAPIDLGLPLDAETARRRLAEAEQRGRSVPTAVPAAFITYGMLCVLGTMSTLGLHLVSRLGPTPGFDGKLAVLIATLAWVAVSILPTLLFRDRWRRGLGRRWLLLMGAWAVLWIVGVLVAESSLVLVIGPLFLALFVGALAAEASTVAARRAPTERGVETGGAR